MGSEVSKASLEHGLLHGFYKQAGLSSCLKCKGFECISSAQGASPTNSELLHSWLLGYSSTRSFNVCTIW